MPHVCRLGHLKGPKFSDTLCCRKQWQSVKNTASAVPIPFRVRFGFYASAAENQLMLYFNKVPQGSDFSPTAESFGVSAQIEGSTRVPRDSARAAGWCEH